MKKIDLYLYIGLTLIALGPFLFLHWLTQQEALQIAHWTALPFLAWVVLSAYYLARWSVRSLRARRAHKQESQDVKARKKPKSEPALY